ncbi:hypothetical protein [Niabella aurantiaca]|uniref:hypothetical protein n=1 Tax=Niabella aurantiaca TaxID=379900 RepID=UPI00037CD649|nr:hypothetical protein [Niabella aurantiaca]
MILSVQSSNNAAFKVFFIHCRVPAVAGTIGANPIKMKIFQSIIIACIVVVFSVGCQKNENAKPPIPVPDNEPTNQMNPYDDFGYWHNVILDSIEQERKTGRCGGFTGSCNYIRKFYRMKNWPELAQDHFNEIPQIVVDASADIYGFIDRSQWSDAVKTKLVQLIQILVDEGDDSCTYACLKNKVKDFEEEVLQTNLSAIDKEVILKAASVARYSGYRWMQRPELREGYDHNVLLAQFQSNGLAVNRVNAMGDRKPNIFQRIGKWIAVTAMDVAGAIGDLSIASGAETSDYISHMIDMTS